MTTNYLAALRGRMKAALASAGLNSFSTAPDNAAAPLVYVGPNEPYLTYEGAAFGHVIAHNQVVLVASPGVNEAVADELDQMIANTVAALEDLVGTLQVGRPGQIAIEGQAHLAVAIDTQTEIDPAEETS